MTEYELMQAILLKYSRGASRLFRTHCGVAWQGNIAEHTPSKLILLNPRALRLGTAGIADLTGWSAGGIYTAIECKCERGRTRPEQLAFLDLVSECGGRSGIARSVDDAGLILKQTP